MNRLFICSTDEQQYRALVQKAQLSDLRIVSQIEQANIILADPPLVAPIIEQAKNLQWLQSTFAGCDRLIAQSKRDYQLTNIRGIFGHLMSEYVFGFLLSMQRHLFDYKEAQAKRFWSPMPYQSLVDKKILLLGTGSIARHIAKTAKHFNMHVSGINQSGDKLENFDAVFDSSRLAQAISNADIIVSVLPATIKTNAMLNKQVLCFANNAILFNVGRGSVLVDDDLLWAIANKHISHAVLDVFHMEPLPENHPFWQHSNISITPHISAVTFAKDAFTIFNANYQRWRAKQPLKHLVDFEQGY